MVGVEGVSCSLPRDDASRGGTAQGASHGGAPAGDQSVRAGIYARFVGLKLRSTTEEGKEAQSVPSRGDNGAKDTAESSSEAGVYRTAPRTPSVAAVDEGRPGSCAGLSDMFAGMWPCGACSQRQGKRVPK